MLKNRKPSERRHYTFDTTVEIMRQLNGPAEITSILPNCDVGFKRSRWRLGFMKSSDVTRTDATTANAVEFYEEIYFENRKRRPHERGRKKRRKGKWNPIDRLWNRANSSNPCPEHLLKQD